MPSAFVLRASWLASDPIEVPRNRFASLPIRLGRNPLNDFAVNHKWVSSFHARIEDVGGKLCIVDLGSKNGVHVVAPGTVSPKRLAPNEPLDLAASNYEFFLSPHIHIKVIFEEIKDALDYRSVANFSGSVLGNRGMLLGSQSELPKAPAGPLAAAVRANLSPPYAGSPSPAAAPNLPGANLRNPFSNPPPANPSPQNLPPAQYPSNPAFSSNPPASLPPLPGAAPAGASRPPPGGFPQGGGYPQAQAAYPQAPGGFPQGGQPGAGPSGFPQAGYAPQPGLPPEQWPMADAPQRGRQSASTDFFQSLGPEALALQGLRELASSLLPGASLETTGDVARFITKVHDTLDVFFRSFGPLREGYSQFVSSLDLQRSPFGRNQRSPAYAAIESASTPEAIAMALLNPRDRSFDAPQAVEGIFADLMLHQLALLEGVMRGVRALLEELSPENIAQNTSSHLPLGRNKALWETYCRRFQDLSEERQTFAYIFGPEFTTAYRQYRQSRPEGE